MYIYKTFYTKTKKNTIFLAPYSTFPKIGHIIYRKIGLNRYEKINITPCILSNHYILRFVFNANPPPRNPISTWKMNNTLLIDNCAKEDLKK